MSRPRWQKRNPDLISKTLGWLLKTEQVTDYEDAARFFHANLLWGDKDSPRDLAAIAKEIRRRGTGYGWVPPDGARFKREKRELVRKIKAAHPELPLSGPNRLGVEYLLWMLSERADRPLAFAAMAAEIAERLADELARHLQASTELERLEIERRMNELWRSVGAMP